MRDAVVLRDQVLCRFLALREKVLPRASRALDRYLTDLGYGIRGNAEWGRRVPRYLGRQDAAAGAGAVTPPETLDWAERPLPVPRGWRPPPSLAWWWDDLTL